METELTAPTLKALRRILRAADLGSRKLAAATGLTPSQLLVLREIEQRLETTASVLAAALQFSQATITNIVDRLEAAALVTRERSARDKRQIILHATDAGRAAIEKAPDLLQTRFNERFAILPGWEQAMILAALERLGGILGADEIDAAPLLDAGVIDRPAPVWRPDLPWPSRWLRNKIELERRQYGEDRSRNPGLALEHRRDWTRPRLGACPALADFHDRTPRRGPDPDRT